jgi:probable rRNA maturation factor
MQPNVILERRVEGLEESRLRDFVASACRAVGLRGAVTVLVTGDREMRELNRRFRGKAHSTDVLSFPALVRTHNFSGDIAVALDTAARNARRYGHSVSKEVRILVLHGILHLAGYDHERDKGEMARKESDLRRRFRLGPGLIERAPVRHARRKIPGERVSS